MDRTCVQTIFYKTEKDKSRTHTAEFTDKDIDKIIQDLKDLSDWRHYRRLKNKLNSNK